MLKIMGKKILTIFAEIFCLSKPMHTILKLISTQCTKLIQKFIPSLQNSVYPDQLASSEAS